MKRIGLIASVTFREAARKKLLLFALLAGMAFLALFATAVHFQVAAWQQQHLPLFARAQLMNGMLLMGLYAVNMLVVVMTVLVSVDTLSGEIASGTIQAIATKPVRRAELILGKWFGFAGMLTLYILLMALGVNAVTQVMAGVVVRHLAQGLALIWMESLLLLAVTFLFGTFCSTLTSGVAVLGLHGLAFLGGWVEQAGAVTRTPKAVLLGIVTSVIMPSEALWRRAAYAMQSPLATSFNISPFGAASVPSPLMVVYAGLYTGLFLLASLWRFSRRDL